MTFLEIPIKERPNRLIRYDAPLLAIQAAELRLYLLQLVNALFNKAKKEDALNDKDKAKQALQLARRSKVLESVAISAMGSHNLKYPNASVKQGGICEQDHQAKQYPFLSSKTTRLTRTIGGAGNAAAAAEIRFLSTEFLLEGKRTGITAALRQQQGKVWDNLIALGLPEERAKLLGDLLEQRFSQSDPQPVDRLLKQVFFPLRDQEDVIITPVLHFGLAREFHSRLKQRREDGERIVSHAIKVGGSNPINAGPHNAEIGGLYHHLNIQTPRRQQKRIDKLLAQIKWRKTLLPQAKQLRFDVSMLNPDYLPVKAKVDSRTSIESTATESTRISSFQFKSHIVNRRRYQAALHQMARQLLQTPIEIAYWLGKQNEAKAVLAQEEFQALPTLEQRFLIAVGLRQSRLSAQEIEALAKHLCLVFSQAYRYEVTQKEQRKKTERLSHDQDRQDLRKALRTQLRELG